MDTTQQPTSPTKSHRWIGWMIASPFLLFVVLAVLLYLPPIQKHLIDKAATYASQATGMDIRVGRIALSFPLDLVVKDIQATEGNDTLLQLEYLKADIQLLPLLKQKIELDGITLKKAVVDTRDKVAGMHIKGQLGSFFAESHGVIFDPETAVINRLSLTDTHLDILLNDTTKEEKNPQDTLFWKIILKKMDLENVSLELQMPQSALNLTASTRNLSVRNGKADLHQGAYSLESFILEASSLNFNDKIALTDVDAMIDSIYYCGKDIRANISRLDGKEQSGMELVNTEGKLAADTRRISLPYLNMKTTASSLRMKADIGWELLDMNPYAALNASLQAQIGKEDVARLTQAIDSTFQLKYPNADLLIHTAIDGNLNNLMLKDLSAQLPNAFQIKAQGQLKSLTDSLKRGGEITLHAEAKNMDFLTTMGDGRIAIPQGTGLVGSLNVAGSDVKAELTLTQSANTVSVETNDSTLQKKVQLEARYNLGKESYQARADISHLDIHHFLPKDSIFGLTTHLEVQGQGLDMTAPQTMLSLKGNIEELVYTTYQLTGYHLDAQLKEQQLDAQITADNRLMDLDAEVKALLKPDTLKAHLTMDIHKMDWQALKLVEVPMTTSHVFQADFQSDLLKEYRLNASITQSTIRAPKRTFKAKDLFVAFETQKDSTQASILAGDLDMRLDAQGYIEDILTQTDTLLAIMDQQWTTKTIDQEILKKKLPALYLHITSGKENPICNFLNIKGISYDQLAMDLHSSPETGLNGNTAIYGMHTDSLTLDTISLNLQHGEEGIDFLTRVASHARKGQEAFDVGLNGYVRNGTAQVMVQYLNAQKEKGVYMGLNAELRKRGIRMKLIPENPILVYRPFTLNKQNYIYLTDHGRIYGNISLHDEQGTGLGFYANRQDSLANQDINIELSRINLKEFKRILPYLPDMEGWLGGEARYVDSQGEVSISGDLRMEGFIYEGNPLGNWEANAVYLPNNDGTHYVDGFIHHNGEETVYINGAYLAEEKGNLEADMSLTEFPLSVINPFVPDKFVEFEGKVTGMFSMEGEATRPVLNGEVHMDSVYMTLPELSVRFRFDDKPVQMVNSKLTFQDYHIYTAGKSPFAINGTIDLSHLEKVKTDLHMKAKEYELMNAKKTKRAMTYGKIYVDVDATLKGTVDELKMRGNMNILGKTDFTYILKDSPLAVNDRLGDMVTFVNFNDTLPAPEVEKQPITLNGMDIAMTIHIDQAVQAHIDLTPDGSNYMLVEGGGDLSFQYTPQGNMLLNGRYSLISGELKYEIPIIPLKTFNIKNGSYIEWSGNPMNPQLNIKATEQIRSMVGENKQTPRMVSFDVGIELTERLENLGLAFTLESPEDATVQEQLNTMSPEERGKLAVTMLVTGMYMAEGNSTGGFNVNNALNSFLQSQISSIAGKALDVSLGMETLNNAAGGKQTDYNFQFSKRFWNNRFRIVIGGKVSTGHTAQQDETFIDNVSIEYRLDNSGTRYVKLFHDKNYESILEGEVTETGIGIVLRKKMSRLGELFIFRRNENEE